MNIITYIYEKTRPYHFNIIISILVIFFSIIAYYAYNKYFASKQNMKPFDNVANANDSAENNSAQIYFFHAQWCPHCQKAYPEWTKFATVTNKKVINGYLVECIEVDCTGDNGDGSNEKIEATPHDTAELISKYNINSYPTIKMIKDGETIDFEAKITENSLQKFVKSVLE
uniref:Thioredoxin-like fold domain-containing protein n=1 Tax=viral metagenome TaxID=1070528 RepID=A0A6C0HY38_9ZZZZ